MAEIDDERPRPKVVTVGEPLDTLSVADLAERVSVLREEITRTERAIAAKEAGREAADAVFRR
jgi:uncharacterized small protein (DUF1192 family)